MSVHVYACLCVQVPLCECANACMCMRMWWCAVFCVSVCVHAHVSKCALDCEGTCVYPPLIASGLNSELSSPALSLSWVDNSHHCKQTLHSLAKHSQQSGHSARGNIPLIKSHCLIAVFYNYRPLTSIKMCSSMPCILALDLAIVFVQMFFVPFASSVSYSTTSLKIISGMLSSFHVPC